MQTTVRRRAGNVIRKAARLAVLASLAGLMCSTAHAAAKVTGEREVWHGITVTFDGPSTSEDATPNPFRDYRLNVAFTHVPSGKRYLVPGFFAADGNAAETSAKAGNKWRCHFTPDQPGEWRFVAGFRTGPDVAMSLDPEPGARAAPDGAAGSFRVSPSDKTGRDFRAKGLLRYVGEHYLRHAASGEYFLKGGADSPENFLAYFEFDDTFDTDARFNEGQSPTGKPFIHH
jgi:hypothetical protein